MNNHWFLFFDDDEWCKTRLLLVIDSLFIPEEFLLIDFCVSNGYDSIGLVTTADRNDRIVSSWFHCALKTAKDPYVPPKENEKTCYRDRKREGNNDFSSCDNEYDWKSRFTEERQTSFRLLPSDDVNDLGVFLDRSQSDFACKYLMSISQTLTSPVSFHDHDGILARELPKQIEVLYSLLSN